MFKSKLTVVLFTLLCSMCLSLQAQTIEFSSDHYSAIYMRIVKPPLPDYLLANWVDPNGYLTVVTIKNPEQCHAYEVTTFLSDRTSHIHITTTSTSSSSASSPSDHLGIVYLLPSLSTPIRVSIKCLMINGDEEMTEAKTR